MKPIIEAKNVSKRYSYRTNAGNTNLREDIYDLFTWKKRKQDTFLALDDVSFNIHQGESIGIIGDNGAGKSTLLKILSNITLPTKGSVTIRGSISSILEVGTGFHPELTGRENVYFNGALHGLSRKEIKAKFDEIVDFSGVEKFLDTPFKHYSSGMQVRLAFAIISHLESDVFITDEVLAVGDASFQKKSMKKMEDVFSQGRTIIFVSHQQSMVSSLTERCLLLEKGKLIADGPTKEVIKSRFKREGDFNSYFENNADPHPAQYAKLRSAEVVDTFGRRIEGEINTTTTFFVSTEFEILQNSNYYIEAVLQLRTVEGYLLFTTTFKDFPEDKRKKGRVSVKCIIPGNLLNVGQYFISIALISTSPIRLEHFYHKNCLSVGIKNNENEELFTFYGDYIGSIKPKMDWQVL